MSNINKQALREAAEKATPGRWEYLPGNTSIEYNVDSMDEDQGSIVYVDSGDFTQNQTDLNGAFIAAANPATVLALLDELEAKDRRNAELNSTLERWATDRAQSASELDDAEKRIAELEAREVVLPQRYSMLHRADFDEPYHTEMVYKQHQVLEALHDAGISIKGE